MGLAGDAGRSKRGGSDTLARADQTLPEDVLSSSVVLDAGDSPGRMDGARVDRRLLVSDDEEQL